MHRSPATFPYGKNDLRNIFYRSDKKYDAKAGVGVCATLRRYATKGRQANEVELVWNCWGAAFVIFIT